LQLLKLAQFESPSTVAFHFNLRCYSKVQVISCFRLNGRPSQRLFDHRVNVLPYVDAYENIGVTGRGLHSSTSAQRKRILWDRGCV
jgi:hypothetical protein